MLFVFRFSTVIEEVVFFCIFFFFFFVFSFSSDLCVLFQQ